MGNCMVCERIELTKSGRNPYFVKELSTGYIVIGDHQRIKGYSLFLCKEHATELHFLEPSFRDRFLHEMAIVAEAVYNAFQPDKLNYELLGAGDGMHMHWHIFPRRKGDTETGGPVWKLGAELMSDEFLPTPEELEDLKARLRSELEKLLEKEGQI
ncbi:MAG: HIT family protein [Lachnospiraceae bacterium]|nr:HIT family protein [Lachnospiraceae bacterium]MDE6918604.1 HIT family protein [Lachnospiraceae bacterium]